MRRACFGLLLIAASAPASAQAPDLRGRTLVLSFRQPCENGPDVRRPSRGLQARDQRIYVSTTGDVFLFWSTADGGSEERGVSAPLGRGPSSGTTTRTYVSPVSGRNESRSHEVPVVAEAAQAGTTFTMGYAFDYAATWPNGRPLAHAQSATYEIATDGASCQILRVRFRRRLMTGDTTLQDYACTAPPTATSCIVRQGRDHGPEGASR